MKKRDETKGDFEVTLNSQRGYALDKKQRAQSFDCALCFLLCIKAP